MSHTPPPTGTGERAAILSKIRTALHTPTSEHVKHDRHASQAGAERGAETPIRVADSAVSSLLPPVGASSRDLIDRFNERSAGLRTDFHLLDDIASAAALLNRIAGGLGWKRVAFHNHPLLNQMMPHLPVERLAIGPDYDRETLEQCDAGITVCDSLIAQTGSVLLTARSAGGRALSVLPAHHVVVATIDQLLPDLPAAYALLARRYADNWPSFATIITGPSRTGDIERILVLGAHGPKFLTVMLINQNQEP